MTDDVPSDQPAAEAEPKSTDRHPKITALVESCPSAEFEESATGQTVVRVDPDEVIELVSSARTAGFDMFIDVTAVDYHRQRPEPRFDLVISLLAVEANLRLRILVGLPSDAAEAPSITSIYPGAGFFEREVYDLFGITFTGHPDLTRILMPDDWEGHPLRKDYPVGSIPVQFRDAHKAQ